MDQIKFNSYKNYQAELAQLKSKEKVLKGKMKELEDEFMKYMIDNNKNRLEFDDGSFSLEISKIRFKPTKGTSKIGLIDRAIKDVMFESKPEKTIFKTIIDIENDEKKKKKSKRIE